MKSIVIAKYTEDKSWIKDIPSGWNIHLYDKDRNLENAPGREAHTYLKFIVDNYESLEGDYVFCQGNPFDHTPDFLGNIYVGELPGKDYPCTRHNRSNLTDSNALQMDKYIRLLELEVPENWEFRAGAQFKAKAEDILKRPRDFYRKCLELTLTDPQSGYIFEGLWKFIL